MLFAYSFALGALGLPRPALADTHCLFSGYFSDGQVVALEFDDAASTLTLAQTYSVPYSAGTKWINLDAKREHLYTAAVGAYQSYALSSNLSLTYTGNVTTPTDCTFLVYVTGATTSPYSVFGASFATGCSGLAMSVDDSGNLQSALANITYDESAGVHGLGLSPDNAFVYSADDTGNAVWAHSYDSATGDVSVVQKFSAPTGSDPRHVTVHPNGEVVYVVYEAACEVAVYSRDVTTGELSDTNVTYSLMPSTFTNISSYWAVEAKVSQPTDNGTSPKYLVAGLRSRTSTVPGYVSAFALDADSGNITSQLFIAETTSYGGSVGNEPSPALFSEEYFALTDSGSNFIEVWKIDGTAGSVVAHLDLDGDPVNAVWYS